MSSLLSARDDATPRKQASVKADHISSATNAHEANVLVGSHTRFNFPCSTFAIARRQALFDYHWSGTQGVFTL